MPTPRSHSLHHIAPNRHPTFPTPVKISHITWASSKETHQHAPCPPHQIHHIYNNRRTTLHASRTLIHMYISICIFPNTRTHIGLHSQTHTYIHIIVINVYSIDMRTHRYVYMYIFMSAYRYKCNRALSLSPLSHTYFLSLGTLVF